MKVGILTQRFVEYNNPEKWKEEKKSVLPLGRYSLVVA